jgi:bloom syndrome protein
MEGVRSVIAYCQNEVDCRRVQVLHYFGQNFDANECRGGCNNCEDVREVQEEDLTSAAVDFLKMVQFFRRSDQVTKAQCLEIYRGANLKAIRDKGLDQNSLFGSGQKLSRDQADRLIDHLLVNEALREDCVANNQGWNNLYIQVICTNLLDDSI